ncbi:oligopeptide-binding protein OppA [Peptoclostridium acidaminophilum DSM 3953]|uniref:Oligopeptide-binding protein OppA n=1 Tax=Peptoclostridium acidaminophilum DSM 3953 TaxID=1286171 RepID=W8TDW4_PEPAC|nr:peptide ABC transporter substrate-binding protein [Peptoclostridium acidaminophilum]AHM56013.1 oligopeptide-binding protein OppA [Peptoclostridium acidaminophilum DSM 3953]
MKKIISLILAAMLIMMSFVGCGIKEKAGGDEKIMRYNLSSPTKTIDPTLNISIDGGIIIVNAFEGLMRLDENDKAIPGMAEKYEVSEDGLTYTFHIRDAQWSDGEPVTAKDFEYSWKRVLDSATASDYAYQMFYLKNGEKFNGKQVGADEVGVKAVDDKTLEVKLEGPVPYFIELTAYPTYFPVRQDVIEKYGDKWALEPETYISNGPYKAVKLEQADVFSFEKNEKYYDAKRVKLDGIDYYFMEEKATAMASFESGYVDGLYGVPREQIAKLQKENKTEFKIFPNLGIYFYSFNVNVEPMNNRKVRQALSLAIDRKSITRVITQGGETAATGFVPSGIKDSSGNDFREIGGNYGITETAQIDRAKQLLAEAGYPNGEGLNTLEIIYNTDENHKKVAEAIQEMWKQNLGINVELSNQEWQVFQDTITKGEYMIARDGWSADYADPMTFLDLFISNSGNNHPQWENAEFDALISSAKKESDQGKRFQMMHQAEEMMMADQIVMPVYYYTNPMMFKSYVKDVRVSPLGFIYFDNADIVKE